MNKNLGQSLISPPAVDKGRLTVNFPLLSHLSKGLTIIYQVFGLAQPTLNERIEICNLDKEGTDSNIAVQPAIPDPDCVRLSNDGSQRPH